MLAFCIFVNSFPDNYYIYVNKCYSSSNWGYSFKKSSYLNDLLLLALLQDISIKPSSYVLPEALLEWGAAQRIFSVLSEIKFILAQFRYPNQFSTYLPFSPIFLAKLLIGNCWPFQHTCPWYMKFRTDWRCFDSTPLRKRTILSERDFERRRRRTDL